MSLATLRIAAGKIFAANLPSPILSVVWHAGEPLTVSRAWYVAAFAILAELCPPSITMVHNFQTNGVLIDHDWLAFFRDYKVRVGVSLDGPAWLHDKHRHARDARGTHAKVMRGMEVLRRAEFPFHIICVLTRDSLNHPDEILDFLTDLKPVQLCFNIEEIESANRQSSLAADVKDSEQAYRFFMTQIVHRLRSSGNGILGGNTGTQSVNLTQPGESAMRIREIDEVLSSLRHPEYGHLPGNSQNLPGHIMSIAWDGGYTTYSPELLGQKWPNGEDLVLGNLLTDALPPDKVNANYAKQWSAIRQGIKSCKAECDFFNLCLGGAPANKLAENGCFESTETLFCRLTKKILIEVVLDALEKDLPAPTTADSEPQV